MGGEIISDASNKRLATPRRIVTAADGDGRSRVASDGHALVSLEIAGPGSTRFFNAWHTEPADRLPYSIGSADPAATFTDMSQIFPGPGGTHLTVSIWPPSYPPADTLPMWMHSTDTVDYIIIISGEISCFFDSGEKVVLTAGDCLVQNGTEHAWRNEGSTDCVMAAIAVGVARNQTEP